MGTEKPEREEKEEEEGSGRKVGAGLKHHLGAIDLGAKLGPNNHGAKIYGTELGAKIYGAKLPAKSPPRLRRAQDLGARIYGAKTCKLGANNNGAELRVQILKAYLQGHICEKKFKKRTKTNNLAGQTSADSTTPLPPACFLLPCFRFKFPR